MSGIESPFLAVHAKFCVARKNFLGVVTEGEILRAVKGGPQNDPVGLYHAEAPTRRSRSISYWGMRPGGLAFEGEVRFFPSCQTVLVHLDVVLGESVGKQQSPGGAR